MAMKKILLFIILPICVLIIGAGVYIIVVTNVNKSPDELPAVVNMASINLPKEDKAAKKELQDARKTLAKLKPNKPYIVIDTHSNRIQYRTADSILLDATCSTGSGGEYVDSTTGRKWIFDTPRGVFKIGNKIPHPWWRKPDWAFLEEGEKIPKNEKERYDPNMMGDYAIGFGDGYFIHGTIYERLLGINVTHGCVRLGSDDLEKLYKQVQYGTMLYIF
jgi:lipoprotein-anchoring transpeptidase ErfK/SrfK